MLDTTAKQVLNDAYKRMADLDAEREKEVTVQLKDEDVEFVVSPPYTSHNSTHPFRTAVCRVERPGDGRRGTAGWTMACADDELTPWSGLMWCCTDRWPSSSFPAQSLRRSFVQRVGISTGRCARSSVCPRRKAHESS